MPRRLRLEVTERVRFDGTVETPLDEAAVKVAAKRFQELGVAAVAVWVTSPSRRLVLAGSGALLLLVAADIRTQRAYVEASRRPVDLPKWHLRHV